MKRYLIKREMEGAGDIPKNDLNAAENPLKKSWRQ